MGGCFYLLDGTNKDFHDKNAEELKRLRDEGMEIPQAMKAWEATYWAIVASLGGYGVWIAGLWVGIGLETKRKVELGLV